MGRVMMVIKNPNPGSLTDAQRFAAIIEFSEDAIITKDVNGIITSWNPGAQRLFGYLTEEVLGKSVTILIPQVSSVVVTR